MLFFFFSSRRRHTRCSRDWSSDVCSSDLTEVLGSLPMRAVPSSWIDHPSVSTFSSVPTTSIPAASSISRPVATMSSAILRSLSERSEEHTSELQSRLHLVCRLLLEKKKKKIRTKQTL